jgi:hypothetical protein
LVAVAAAVLLVVADFSEISFRTIGIGACSDRVDPGVCRTYGHDSHSFVLVVVGLVALLMAWGAVVGRSRAAAIAVAALGVVVLFIALAVDLPKLDDKRGLEVRYNDVAAHTGTAFKLELTGGVLLLLTGGLALVRAGSDGEPWQPRRRRPRAEEASEGDDESMSGAEARARERARRRAARERAGAAVADPPPAVAAPPAEAPMPPPEPGTAAGSEPEADSAAEPPERPGAEAVPAPEADAAAPTDPPDTGTAGPTDPSDPGAAAAPEPVASPDADEELGPEAYRPPDVEPDPPARS